ncbi:MAG TPA: hypothetical protein VF793_11310 [Telluria sp.]
MNANDLFKAVMEIDLTPIKTKLMHVESGEGWSLEKTNAVEKEYRRFLCLMKLFPEEDTAPLVDVDTFWHYHILDTMKYAVDCEQVFGYFLHHYPYVGMDGSEDDEQFRLDSGDRMRTLYESIFGEDYPNSLEAGPAVAASLPHTELTYAGADTAYCASPVPRKSANATAGTAYCASPVPRKPAHASANIAYCASPVPRKPANVAADIAYCASPVPRKSVHLAANTAYCASPVPRKPAHASADIAYCASPVPRKPAHAAAGVSASRPDSAPAQLALAA